MAKPKARKLEKKSKFVTSKLPINDQLVFSFKHFDLAHTAFNLDGCESRYFGKVLDRLRSLSAMKVSEFHSNRSPSLRAHPITWSDTSQPDGFAHLNQQLRDCSPFQFAISANDYGRVHGFIIKDVFFVVWLDPNHSLYPPKK